MRHPEAVWKTATRHRLAGNEPSRARQRAGGSRHYLPHSLIRWELLRTQSAAIEPAASKAAVAKEQSIVFPSMYYAMERIVASSICIVIDPAPRLEFESSL